MKAGDRFLLGGELYVCQYVNSARAHCVPVRKKPVTVLDRKTGTPRTFHATLPAIDLAASTDVDALRLLEEGRY